MLIRVSKPPCSLLKITNKCMFLGLSESALNFLQDTVLRFLRNVLVFEKSLVKSPLRRATVRRAREQRLFRGRRSELAKKSSK